VTDETPKEMTAAAYMRGSASAEFEYVFANGGNDLPRIVESPLPQRRQGGTRSRLLVGCPTENVAMAMAHGYYRTCGKPACVMVHVKVGTRTRYANMTRPATKLTVLIAAAAAVTRTGQWSSRSLHSLGQGYPRPGLACARVP